MSTKSCSRCKIEKDISAFGKQSGHKTGLNPACKDCVNKYHKTLYASNESRRLYLKTKTAGRIVFKKQWIWNYLLEHPCVDCGETDPVVLEFDHIYPETKSFNISNKINEYGLKKLKEEIDKCEIRCANCHRRKTAKQFGWHKFLD